jgi:hypothetical protein
MLRATPPEFDYLQASIISIDINREATSKTDVTFSVCNKTKKTIRFSKGDFMTSLFGLTIRHKGEIGIIQPINPNAAPALLPPKERFVIILEPNQSIVFSLQCYAFVNIAILKETPVLVNDGDYVLNGSCSVANMEYGTYIWKVFGVGCVTKANQKG